MTAVSCRHFALTLVCAGCSSHTPERYFSAEPPSSGRYIVLEKGLPSPARTSAVIRIRVRPGHKTDGELQLLHWHEPGHIAMGTSPSHDLLDSIEQKERHALEVSYGCRKWQPLVEYHGNWG